MLFIGSTVLMMRLSNKRTRGVFMAVSEARKAANRRYTEKNYRQVKVNLPIALVEEFRATTKANGDSQAAIVRKAIEKYLGK